MKISYLLIGGFVVWCLVASQWYLFGVKGLTVEPAHFSPHQTSLAIFEIMLMLLISVLLGFAIAWYLRQASIEQIQYLSKAVSQESEVKIERIRQKAQKEVATAESKWVDASRQEYKTLSSENGKIKDALIEKDETIRLLKEELQNLRPKVQLANVELGRTAMQVKQLENHLANERMVTNGLKQELEQAHTPKRKHVELSIEKISEKNKDDLKMISGIGPVIESKLNAIGIYTFKQISEFSPQTIESVTESIKFFPDRIGRDNWIGQAAALMRYRK
jgi:predicted flap endonuclease-1-like 5' DNA nuclease